MPKYFFHIDNGTLMPDGDGTEMADIEEARAEAVSLAGAILNDLGGKFWSHGEKWALHVTDEESRLLFSIHVGAETPSGEVRYLPLTKAT